MWLLTLSGCGKRRGQGARIGSHFNRSQGDRGANRSLTGGLLAKFLEVLGLMERDDLVPTFDPPTITDQVPQSQHGVYMRVGPTHTGLFETAVNDDLMAALDRAGTNRKALSQKMRIINQFQALS
jgi:hypothetical protein